MDCNEARRLLDADADGELDLVRHLVVAAHLQACPECARRAEAIRVGRTVMRETLPRFTAPPPLAEKIRVALRSEGKNSAENKNQGRAGAPTRLEEARGEGTASPSTATTSTANSAPRRPWWFSPVWNVAGLAASLAFALLVGFAWGQARARGDLLVGEAVSDHVRSLQAGHLTDVASTDRHTVKPWFAGKLDFAPPVVDLAAAGFPLTGGRLEHIDGQRAAALVFQRRQHAVNLLIWPATVEAAPRRAARDGYNLELWSRNGMNFLAVSEIPAAELAQFAEAFRAGTL